MRCGSRSRPPSRSAEVAALWITDCDDLEMKLSLAEQCGDSARQCRKIVGAAGGAGRGAATTRATAAIRSCSRSCARCRRRRSARRPDTSPARRCRWRGWARWPRSASSKGDADSARLLGVEIADEERRYYEQGKRMLVGRRRDRGEPGARAPRRLPDARARGRDRRAAAAAQGPGQAALTSRSARTRLALSRPQRHGCYSRDEWRRRGSRQAPSAFGRYTLLERLAVGGMAEVFRAKIASSHGFEKILVIKRILPAPGRGPDLRRRCSSTRPS